MRAVYSSHLDYFATIISNLVHYCQINTNEPLYEFAEKKFLFDLIKDLFDEETFPKFLGKIRNFAFHESRTRDRLIRHCLDLMSLNEFNDSYYITVYTYTENSIGFILIQY